jgi:hypothetical protein
MGYRTKAAIAGITALWVASLALPTASAEVAQQGNIIVSFSGQIVPQRLPRTELAPVSVQMGGKIKTTDRQAPPKLERIVLDINKNGRLQSKGLATCSLRRLESISASAAERACGDALIGHGNVTSRVTLPGQGAFASNGPLLAFNGRKGGRQAIFAQVATSAPLPLTYVIVFKVQKAKGAFGAQLVGELPPIASSYGYISAFSLSLARRYIYRGEQMSFASASCAAPKSLPGGVFPFARASYVFEDGRTLSKTLVRQCKVRGS